MITYKAKVLKKRPKAYAKFAGLSMKIVIVDDFRGPDISGYFDRERDAWRSAARNLRPY